MKKNSISLLLVLMIGMMSFVGCTNNTSQPAATPEQNKEETVEPAETPATVTETPVPETGEQSEAEESADTGATETETAAQAEPEELVAEFEPDAEYDKYTLVYYIVEDIDARFTATVSAMDDGSEYEVRCSVDGEEQTVKLDKDLQITEDKTGNMSYDAPIIVQKAIDADNWTKVEE